MTSSLQGKRVLVTRPKAQAEGFASRLREFGAIPLLLPAIEIQPLEDPSLLDNELRHLETFDWVVFTSVNGVAAVKERLQELGISTEVLAARKLAAIGPATAESLESLCRAPDLMPDEYVAEAIGTALGDVAGLSFLLARADIARPDLADLLKRGGAKVTEVAAYHIKAEGPAELEGLEEPDFITLTSSSAAKSTIDRLLAGGRGEWLIRADIVCIGPITADTVRGMGYKVAATAAEYTAEGLVQTLLQIAPQEASYV